MGHEQFLFFFFTLFLLTDNSVKLIVSCFQNISNAHFVIAVQLASIGVSYLSR